MTSEPLPAGQAGRPAKLKDLLITILTLCLCLCMAALIYETQKHQEVSKLYSNQVEKFQTLQRTLDRSLADAMQAKAQSDQALRRAQLALKASNEAQGIALRLRQAAARTTAQSH